jgi:ubiquitin C-terminal hydrolase
MGFLWEKDRQRDADRRATERHNRIMDDTQRGLNQMADNMHRDMQTNQARRDMHLLRRENERLRADLREKGKA